MIKCKKYDLNSVEGDMGMRRWFLVKLFITERKDRPYKKMIDNLGGIALKLQLTLCNASLFVCLLSII